MMVGTKKSILVTGCGLYAAFTLPMNAQAFVAPKSVQHMPLSSLKMGMFDRFKAGGSGRDNLDEEVSKGPNIMR